MPKRRLAVDLFSGAGGLSLGLERAGWIVAAAADHDKAALETHRHNFSGLCLGLDLGDQEERNSLVELLTSVDVDLIAGGPPCQPFSRAGRSKIRSLVEAGIRDPQDPRGALWQAYLDVVLRVRPRAVLMENVPDMALGDDLLVVRTIEQALNGAGYATQVRLVDAWEYGVPQHRRRLILLARNDSDEFTWPDVHQRPVTLEDAIRDLPPLDGTTGARRLPYSYPPAQSAYMAMMREGAEPDGVWDHMTRPVRDDDREIFALMGPRTLYSDIPKRLRRYKVDHFDDKYKRLAWNERSRSITAHIAKDGYWYIHPEELRTLTVREAARIQTFPDRFRFAGTRSDAFRQIGNAVPPLLAEAAAKALRPSHQGAGRTSSGTAQWVAARRALSEWAHKRLRDGEWFLFPGPFVTAPVAALAAVLCTGRTNLNECGAAFADLRGRRRMDAALLDAVARSLPTRRAQAAAERLRPLTAAVDLWERCAEIPDAAGFKPAEKALFRLFLGEDLLLTSQGAIRVAARVAGSGSDQVNRLSDGRVDLARLVGAGEESPIRMAALWLLGTNVCYRTEPRCADCPVQEWCAARAAATRKPATVAHAPAGGDQHPPGAADL